MKWSKWLPSLRGMKLHETQGVVTNFIDNVIEQFRHIQLAFTVLWDMDASSFGVKVPSHFPSG